MISKKIRVTFLWATMLIGLIASSGIAHAGAGWG